MIYFGPTQSNSDLNGILELQYQNLSANLEKDEIQSQGFVTVHHSFAQLQKLDDYERHIIARDGDKVVGYVLAMTEKSKADIPVLVPMFEVFNQVDYRDRKVSDYNYLVIGQVCIDKAYRGQGLFANCYEAYKKHYGKKYDFAITEIDVANKRSLRAHEKIGFKEIHTYTSSEGVEWAIVLWEWDQ